ncbi:MAG: HAMP domain-containing histidine kinase [Deltaproteobacteria bacterium]|nr:HAMP domain-containing histidine kinase [Deltaproteobacteria bacterium]
MASRRARRRIPPVRSLRVRAVAVVVLVLLCPPAFVTLSAVMEGNVEHEPMARLEAALDEALGRYRVRTEVGAPAAPSEDERVALDAIASRHEVWLRVVEQGGRVLLDLQRARSGDVIQRLGELVFGEDGAPTLTDFDSTQGELARRPEVESAFTGRQSRCRTSPEGKLLVCQVAAAASTAAGVAAPDVAIHVEAGVRRSVRALYDLEYQLKKLMLLVLPVALVLAWWLGWRMVRPIEELREQVLEKAALAAPGADLHLARRDEFGDLAAAFNSLLASLESRARANEAFVADLAHETKNPVAAIRTAAESLAAGAVDAERAQRLSKVLGDSSARLDRVVTQFLELARAEAGMRDEPREDVDLAALARALVERARADERHAGVTVTCEADTAAPVNGVAERLEAALRNLLDNALDFAGAGGEVRVAVEARADAVAVTVADTGPGIDAEALPRVFERFFTTRRSRRGTGLGLALVRAIAEAHGGSVRVASPPGSGAVFVLEIPR